MQSSYCFPRALRTSIAAVASLLPLLAGAQPTLQMRPTCATCRITLVEQVAFQSEWRDGDMPTRPYGVQPYRRTDWLIVDADIGRLQHFDARGRHVAEIGRKGGGPGEYEGPSVAWQWGGDSVAVLDGANGRVSILGPTGRYTRSVPWEGPRIVRATVTADGGILHAGRLPTRSGFGHPMHLFGRDMRLVESFGAPENVRVTRAADIPLYRIPPRVNVREGFWAVKSDEPRLRFFGGTAGPAQEWPLPMEGFAPLQLMNIDSPPGAEFFVVDPLPDGSLLVAMVFRERTAAEAFGPEQRVDGRIVRLIDDYSRFFDTMLFVLDPRTKTLVASTSTSMYVVGSLGGGKLWGLKPVEGGAQVVITQVSLVR